MWHYEKKLQYPAKVGKADLKMAKYLITQYGGPDGELGAALRYLNQRYTMPTGQSKGLLNDIGTEESAPSCYQSFIPGILVYKTSSKSSDG
jgi:spore coat protein JC